MPTPNLLMLILLLILIYGESVGNSSEEILMLEIIKISRLRFGQDFKVEV